MGRWEPDAQGRLQQAAMTLFLERGYAEVTVAEIADRAGLTKRTFFNHFADKREVLFAGAETFQASVVKHLTQAAQDLEPIDAAILALTCGGLELAKYGAFARARQSLIASAHELQERELIKTSALTVAIAEGLCQRGVPARAAILSAQAAMTVFNTAYADWAEDTTAELPTLMQRVLDELREVLGGTRDD